MSAQCLPRSHCTPGAPRWFFMCPIFDSLRSSNYKYMSLEQKKHLSDDKSPNTGDWKIYTIIFYEIRLSDQGFFPRWTFCHNWRAVYMQYMHNICNCHNWREHCSWPNIVSSGGYIAATFNSSAARKEEAPKHFCTRPFESWVGQVGDISDNDNVCVCVCVFVFVCMCMCLCLCVCVCVPGFSGFDVDDAVVSLN